MSIARQIVFLNCLYISELLKTIHCESLKSYSKVKKYLYTFLWNEHIHLFFYFTFKYLFLSIHKKGNLFYLIKIMQAIGLLKHTIFSNGRDFKNPLDVYLTKIYKNKMFSCCCDFLHKKGKPFVRITLQSILKSFLLIETSGVRSRVGVP